MAGPIGGDVDRFAGGHARTGEPPPADQPTGRRQVSPAYPLYQGINDRHAPAS